MALDQARTCTHKPKSPTLAFSSRTPAASVNLSEFPLKARRICAVAITPASVADTMLNEVPTRKANINPIESSTIDPTAAYGMSWVKNTHTAATMVSNAPNLRSTTPLRAQPSKTPATIPGMSATETVRTTTAAVLSCIPVALMAASRASYPSEVAPSAIAELNPSSAGILPNPMAIPSAAPRRTKNILSRTVAAWVQAATLKSRCHVFPTQPPPQQFHVMRGLVLALLLTIPPFSLQAPPTVPTPPTATVDAQVAIIRTGGSLRYYRLDGSGSFPTGTVLGISANPQVSTLDLPPFASSDDPRSQEQWALRALGAPAAWDRAQGASVTVAVLDTGVSPHEDLPGLLSGRSFLEDPSTADPNGHGTHVAGIIAAAMGNQLGVSGLAPKASILPVRVLDANGSGDHTAIAAGIVWAVDSGADIINLSLGGEESSDVLASAVAYAAERNVLVVAAAGNSGFDRNEPMYPAAYDSVVAVAASGPDGTATAFSNKGAYIDITAPGFAVLSTYPENGYEYLSGTSQAAPYVSAALALLVSTGLPPGQAVQKLYTSAQDVSPAGWDQATGNGILDAAAALGAPPSKPPALPSPLPNLPIPTLPSLRPPDSPLVLPTPEPMVSLIAPTSVKYGSNFDLTVLTMGCAPCSLSLRTPGARIRPIEVRSDMSPLRFSERALRSGTIEVISKSGRVLATAELAVVSSIKLTSSTRRGQYAYVSGSIHPRSTKVVLQNLRDGKWFTTATATTSSGEFRFKITRPRRGLYRVSSTSGTTSDVFVL
jgi:type VII secretion-associated serine protease mycosin